MRADQAIKYLQEYAPDTELIVAWWDITDLNDYTDIKVTNDEWYVISQRVNKYNDHILSDMQDMIKDTARDVVKDRETSDE